jgi:hypothetical protein
MDPDAPFQHQRRRIGSADCPKAKKEQENQQFQWHSPGWPADPSTDEKFDDTIPFLIRML